MPERMGRGIIGWCQQVVQDNSIPRMVLHRHKYMLPNAYDKSTSYTVRETLMKEARRGCPAISQYMADYLGSRYLHDSLMARKNKDHHRNAYTRNVGEPHAGTR